MQNTSENGVKPTVSAPETQSETVPPQPNQIPTQQTPRQNFLMSPFPPPYSCSGQQFAGLDLMQTLQSVHETLNRLDQQIKEVYKKQKALSLPFKVQKAKQDEECCICQQQISKGKNIVKLNCRCKHAQHIKCITVWLKNNHSCPLCRKRFRVSDDSFLRYQ